MLRLKVARGAAEIADLRSVWESLEHSAQSMFQSYLWNRLAAQVFGAREQPYFILAENDSGAAIVPAVISTHGRSISFAGERLFDYRDYLAAGDDGPLFRAWEELARLELPMCVATIATPERAIWDRLPKIYFSCSPQLSNRGITGHDFAARHSRAFSRLRKLERMGLRICEYSGDSALVRQIYERRAQQSGEGELFQDRLRVEFMVAVCREAGDQCEVFTLEHGQTLAAALVTFRDQKFRRFYTTYYDHDWARYSPGVSLLFEVTRRSLDQGLSFDMMTGEQPYKLRIASEKRPLFQVNATADELRKACSKPIPGEAAA